MLKRWLQFASERYLSQAAPVAFWAVAIDLLVQYLMHAPTLALSRVTLLTATSAVLLGAAVRITDEIKDFDVDRAYFPDRPLVTGRISTPELYSLAILVTGITVALNVIWRWAPVELLLTVLALYLMARWFFLPNVVSKNRFLAIVSNLPCFYLLYLYQGAASARFHGLAEPSWVPYAIAAWMLLPFLSYEFARKTLVPSAERAGYQTYSSMLGYRGASLLGFLFAAAHVALLIPLASNRPFSAVVVGGIVALLAAYAVVLWRFMTKRWSRDDELALGSGAYTVGSLTLLCLGCFGIV